ncbi:MAG: ATP-binding protein [Planctomycetota bacterium]
MLEKKQAITINSILWLHFFRFLVILISIAITIAYASRFPVPPPFSNAYYLLLLMLFFDLFYTLSFRFIKRYSLFIIFQIAVDGIAETALVYLTGGPRSPLSFLYYASILTSVVFISRRGGMFFASVSSIFLAGVTISYFLASKKMILLPLVPQEWIRAATMNLNTLLGYLVAQAVALHFVAFLSGHLAERAVNIRYLYGSVLENMVEGVLVINNNFRVIYANPEMKKLFDIKKDDLLTDKKVEDVFPQLKDNGVIDLMQESDYILTRFKMISPDMKNKLEIEAKFSTFRDKRGKSVGKIGIFNDITLRQQLEESKKKSDRLVEIEEMSFGLAHEIRNPLASIRGCTQELGRTQFLDTDSKRLAEIVCLESDRLDKIISDFLGFAKMQSPMFSKCNLAKLIHEVATLLKSRENSVGVEIITDVAEDINLLCDTGQMKQVFLNLGINSLEALEGSGLLKITARKGTISEHFNLKKHYPDIVSNEGVLISLEDDGQGIPLEYMDKIFTPFFTTKQKGTGIGLAIVNRIVTSHNGFILVNSKPNEGVVFDIWLPLNQKESNVKMEAMW